MESYPERRHGPPFPFPHKVYASRRIREPCLATLPVTTALHYIQIVRAVVLRPARPLETNPPARGFFHDGTSCDVYGLSMPHAPIPAAAPGPPGLPGLPPYRPRRGGRNISRRMPPGMPGNGQKVPTCPGAANKYNGGNQKDGPGPTGAHAPSGRESGTKGANPRRSRIKQTIRNGKHGRRGWASKPSAVVARGRSRDWDAEARTVADRMSIASEIDIELPVSPPRVERSSSGAGMS